jgi:signal transduction histidine kinase
MKVEKDQLRLEVADPGMGISPEHLEKIFHSFYRVDSSLTTEISGTGLGLVIVKAIVEQHGGTIRVESEPGKGTTFLVRVPIHKSPEDLPPGDEPRPFF